MEQPIRVLHILHSMNRGGAENALMNYYRHINREKLQFDFLLTCSTKCDFEDEILSLGGKIFRVPLLTIKRPTTYIKSVSSFFRLHPEYRIVHSHTSSKSALPLWIAMRNGIPIRICHSHNTKSEKGINGFIRDFLKFPLKKVATHWFACGNDAAKWLYGDRAYKGGKVSIVRNVIESERFIFNPETRKHIREQLQVKDDTVIIGITARFNTQKNHSFAIDILQELRAKNKDAKLLLLGEGNLKNDIISKAKSLGILDYIIFAGVVTNVNEYLQAMDIFLMPSFHEGLPLSLIEAQIAGLPCLVSDGVPTESDITGLVTFLPLKDGANIWSDILWKMKNTKRTNHTDEIVKAGYDANTSAKLLQNFYLKVYSK